MSPSACHPSNATGLEAHGLVFITSGWLQKKCPLFMMLLMKFTLIHRQGFGHLLHCLSPCWPWNCLKLFTSLSCWFSGQFPRSVNRLLSLRERCNPDNCFTPKFGISWLFMRKKTIYSVSSYACFILCQLLQVCEKCWIFFASFHFWWHSHSPVHHLLFIMVQISVWVVLSCICHRQQ